jgi:hypothetical protein
VSTSVASACFSAQTGAQYAISGFTVNCSTVGGSGVSAAGAGSIITFGSNMIFGACNGSHLLSSGAAQVFGTASYLVTAGAGAHMNAANSGVISIGGVTVTLTGTPAFGTAFALATGISQINAGGNTYSGSATGTRYSVSQASMVNSAGAGANYFPGSAAGIATTPGFYV